MGTTLTVINELVDHTVDKYIHQYCKQVGQDRDGHPIFGCESGIFAKTASIRSTFEYNIGLEWFLRDDWSQFGPWLFYSAKIKPVARLLEEKGIKTSI